MYILKRDVDLERLEEANKWREAIEYCNFRWENEKEDCDALLRLMSQAWFMCIDGHELAISCGMVHTYKEAIDYFRDDFQLWLDLIKNTLTFGDSNFIDRPAYLCMTGFMISHSPEWFSFSGFDEAITSATERLKKVTVESGDSYYAFRLAVLERQFVKDGIQEELFPGASEVDRYLKECLDHINYETQLRELGRDHVKPYEE